MLTVPVSFEELFTMLISVYTVVISKEEVICLERN